MNEIILKLPANIVDHIGNVLSERPYKEVKGILDMIVMQANDKTLQTFCAPMTKEEIDADCLSRQPQPKD
jgi:hypothetical protein